MGTLSVSNPSGTCVEKYQLGRGGRHRRELLRIVEGSRMCALRAKVVEGMHVIEGAMCEGEDTRMDESGVELEAITKTS